MSYSANFSALWRRAAGYVDRILKGAHPSDMPIEQATEVALNINLKTAKSIGLDDPTNPPRHRRRGDRIGGAGTNRTNRPGLMMSVDRDRPEVAGVLSNRRL
jgi:hypothetical protein